MRPTVSKAVLACALVLALSVGAGPVSGQPAPEQAATKQRYSITDLGTLGGPQAFNSMAFGVNNRGQVVGTSWTAWGDDGAFLWENGEMRSLGSGTIAAHAINDRGQIAGFMYGPPGEEVAFLWEDGETITLGMLPGGKEYSYATDDNDRGQVVGTSEVAPEEYHAFLWERGKMRDLGTLGGAFSDAAGINDRGQVVGRSETASGEMHAFLWERGKMRDLGTLGGATSHASAINDRGQVVGFSETASGEVRAFLWESGASLFGRQRGKMKDLGTLPGGDVSVAADINNRGQVVGNSETAAGSDLRHAFLWERGRMTDLGTLAGTGSLADGISSAASAINDRGQVVGYSDRPSGFYHAVLWSKRGAHQPGRFSAAGG